MNDDKSKLMTHLGVAAFSTAVACLSESQAGIVFPVLSSIATNIASSFFEKAEYNKLKRFFADADPDNLNHDLKKVIIKALQWSINNIEIRYRRDLRTDAHKKELKTFIKKFHDKVNQTEHLLFSNEQTVLAALEKTTSTAEFPQLFAIQTDTFPVIDPVNPFTEFFRREFLPNLQLCFGELLKKEENRPAYIAYTRQIQANLQEGIEQIKKQNEAILHKLDVGGNKTPTAESLEFWTTVQQHIQKLRPNELVKLIGESFDKQLTFLHKKVDLLIDDTGAIRANVGFIKDEVVKIRSEVRTTRGITEDLHYKLRQNWISKHKALFISLMVLFVVILCGLLYYISTRPFTTVFSLQANSATNVSNEYPSLTFPVGITVYLPGDTKQVQITSGNELALNGLPHTYKNKLVKLKVNDPYWEEAIDFVKLSATHLVIPVRPTAYLGRIAGNVKSRDGNISIGGAAIKIGSDTVIYSDDNGFFHVQLPDKMKRKEYSLSVEKKGYSTETQLYHPESGDGQFRLTKY